MCLCAYGTSLCSCNYTVHTSRRYTKYARMYEDEGWRTDSHDDNKSWSSHLFFTLAVNSKTTILPERKWKKTSNVMRAKLDAGRWTDVLSAMDELILSLHSRPAVPYFSNAHTSLTLYSRLHVSPWQAVHRFVRTLRPMRCNDFLCPGASFTRYEKARACTMVVFVQL